MRIVLVVRNLTANAGNLSRTSGFAGPAYNSMVVGHEATKRFLMNRGAGKIDTTVVGPGEALVLSDLTLVPLQCVCGIIEFATSIAEAMEIQVLAIEPGADAVGECETAANCAPDRSNRKGKFDVSGVRPQNFSYKIGGQQLDFQIGDLFFTNLIDDPTVPDPQPLKGEYGVVRSMSVEVSNPTSTAARIALAMSPRGGSATGTFKIDGVWYETPIANYGAFFRLMTYEIGKGASETIEFLTSLELNSSCPITFLVDLDRTSYSHIPVSKCSQGK
jgi:hypothetical protein